MQQTTRIERTPALIPFPITGDHDLYSLDTDTIPTEVLLRHPLDNDVGLVDWFGTDIQGFYIFTDAEVEAILGDKLAEVNFTNAFSAIAPKELL